MTVNQTTTSAIQHRPGEMSPGPSLETLEAVQQVLVQALGGLRESLAAPAAREAGEIEYASWLQRRH